MFEQLTSFAKQVAEHASNKVVGMSSQVETFLEESMLLNRKSGNPDEINPNRNSSEIQGFQAPGETKGNSDLTPWNSVPPAWKLNLATQTTWMALNGVLFQDPNTYLVEAHLIVDPKNRALFKLECEGEQNVPDDLNRNSVSPDHVVLPSWFDQEIFKCAPDQLDVCAYLLSASQPLSEMRYHLVPRWTSEECFWRNVLTRLILFGYVETSALELLATSTNGNQCSQYSDDTASHLYREIRRLYEKFNNEPSFSTIEGSTEQTLPDTTQVTMQRMKYQGLSLQHDPMYAARRQTLMDTLAEWLRMSNSVLDLNQQVQEEVRRIDEDIQSLKMLQTVTLNDDVNSEGCTDYGGGQLIIDPELCDSYLQAAAYRKRRIGTLLSDLEATRAEINQLVKKWWSIQRPLSVSDQTHHFPGGSDSLDQLFSVIDNALETLHRANNTLRDQVKDKGISAKPVSRVPDNGKAQAATLSVDRVMAMSREAISQPIGVEPLDTKGSVPTRALPDSSKASVGNLSNFHDVLAAKLPWEEDDE